MKDFLENLISYAIALLRLVFLIIIAAFNGVHQILFNRVEISNLAFYFIPLRKDRENISYINKLNMNNIDLIQSEPYFEDEEGNIGPEDTEEM